MGSERTASMASTGRNYPILSFNFFLYLLGCIQIRVGMMKGETQWLTRCLMTWQTSVGWITRAITGAHLGALVIPPRFLDPSEDLKWQASPPGRRKHPTSAAPFRHLHPQALEIPPCTTIVSHMTSFRVERFLSRKFLWRKLWYARWRIE